MKRTYFAAAVFGLATAIAMSLPTSGAHAGNGFQIQIGPDGMSIGIDQRRHRRPDDYDDYRDRGPAPQIYVTVQEWVRVRETDRWGGSRWVDRSIVRNVTAYWDPNRRCYWYYDSEGRQTIYRGNY